MVRLITSRHQGMFKSILLWSLLIRILLLIGTCTDFIPLISAHSDSDAFDEMAKANQRRFFQEWEILTNYTIYLTILYSFTDSCRWFAQFLNMMMSMLMLIYLRKILFLLIIPNKYRKLVLISVSFLPFNINYAVILGREAWILLFITISLYHFISWYVRNGNENLRLTLCVINLLIAMSMHSGVIGLLVGYFLAFISYDYKSNKIKITRKSYIGIFFLLVLCTIIVVEKDILLAKFMSNETMDYIEYKNSSEKAESAYLTWLEYSSPEKVLLFSPLKLFYFLYSPIIFDWRGLNDALAFFLDSTVYMVATWFIFTRKVEDERLKLLKKYLLVSFWVTTFLFAFGTNSSGDAIRHREKGLCVMLVAAAISTQKKSERSVKIKKELINTKQL